jgi:putative membrane protein
MFHLIIRVVITALALILAANVIPGITIGSFGIAIIAAIVLGILNVLVKPVLFILTLPITILTLGLFSFVLNALMFWLAAYFVTGFVVAGFLPALLGSLIVTAVSTVTHHLFA